MDHLSSSKRRARSYFVSRVIVIMAIGWALTTILNYLENSGRIEELAEHQGRLISWAVLIGWLNWLSYRCLTTPRLRSVIPISTIFVLAKLTIDVTRHMPVLNDVPIIGRASPFSYILPPVCFAAAIISTLMVLYLIVRWYDEVCDEVESLSRSTSRIVSDELSAISKAIGETLGCRAVVMSELVSDEELQVRSEWHRGPAPPGNPRIATPIQLSPELTSLFRRANVQAIAPNDARLRSLDASGYLALSLQSSNRCLGYLEIIDDAPLDDDVPQRLLLTVARDRATAELMRIQADRSQQQAREIVSRTEYLVSIGRMAAGVAHEVNNPLCIISLHTELARTAIASQDGPELGRCLDAISAASERASRIVDNVLKSAREDTVDKWSVDLRAIARRVRDFMKEEASKRLIRIDLIADSNPPHITVNPTSIEQLVVNLVSNAMDASPEGGAVTVAINQRDSHLCLAVSDQGSGVDQDTVRHIFDPFYTTKKGGTGLGLSIVHRIASEHDANLVVDTAHGEGTTVQIDFPLT